MLNSRLVRAGAFTATSALLLTITGCSDITDQLHNQSTSKYASTAELELGWQKSAPWLPAGASDIRIREALEGDPAILLASSADPLDPELCAETERQSAPTYDDVWSPDPYAVDSVFACGDWAVIPVGGGWFGWTPNDPDEKAASPEHGS